MRRSASCLGSESIYENGIAYCEFYHHTNKEECRINKYHIAGYEKPSAYNKLGLFDLVMRGPTAVTLGLDPEYFHYYRNDREEGPTFDTAYWRPSVNGVVVLSVHCESEVIVCIQSLLRCGDASACLRFVCVPSSNQ